MATHERPGALAKNVPSHDKLSDHQASGILRCNGAMGHELRESASALRESFVFTT